MKQKDLEMNKGSKKKEHKPDAEKVGDSPVEENIEATQTPDCGNPQDAEPDEAKDRKGEEKPVDSELANIIEAALFAAKAPLGVRNIMALFPDDAQPGKVDIQNVIISLQEQCEFRGIELRRIGKGWRYQSKEKYSPWLRKLSGVKPPRYSRALLETLSIIAYRQPVTRGDIEEIRGVGVSSDTIRTLEERDWVAQIGHRDVPGRPALFGTTQGFLEYFNMTSLRELPDLMEKRGLGEIAKDMNMTLPMDGVQDGEEAEQHQQSLNDEQESESESAEVIELHPNGQEASESSDEAQVQGTNQEESLNDSEQEVEPSLSDAQESKESEPEDQSDNISKEDE